MNKLGILVIFLSFLDLKVVTTTVYKSSTLNSINFLYQQNRKIKFKPDSYANPFEFETLNHGLVQYPNDFASKIIGVSVYSSQSGFIEAMWNNITYIQEFIKLTPTNTSYIFMSLEKHSKKNVVFMRNQLVKSMKQMMYSDAQISSFLSNCYFAVKEVSFMNNWIYDLLSDWSCEGHGCGFDQVEIFSGIPLANKLKRLDARYDWALNHNWKPETLQLVFEGDPCNCSSNKSNTVVLVDDTETDCTVAQKVLNLQSYGAAGILVMADYKKPVRELNCYGADCNYQVNIPVSSIEHDFMVRFSARYFDVKVKLVSISSPNFFFTIDSFGKLAEFGWALYPSLEFLSWQMVWLDYKASLNKTINQLDHYVVPVFNKTTMAGHNGTGEFKVKLNDVENYDQLYLEASLGCEGERDEDCPPWDHVASLYVCCDNNLCGTELGRWITPFRRRNGRWLTDVSPLLPVLHPNSNQSKESVCTFEMKSDAWWAKSWLPSLNLRFKKDVSTNEKPFYVEPLFTGGVFDSKYNLKYKPHYFLPPSNVKKVQVFSVISGHGSDNNQCGEFCVTQHIFTVNNKQRHNLTFSQAGTPLGCTEQVKNGAVPNEHGTWLYGRGGWCDGMPVKPWVFDITSEVSFGALNSVTYKGLFNNKDPDPTSNPGLIKLTSFLVFYK